jgi:signal transduction histidine kinase
MNMKQYNLSEQLCECLLPFESVWEEKNIELMTEIEDDVNVISDMQLMSIVWNNILSNAFKFTPENGQVTVSLTSGKKYAVVKISDTGCGIPEGQTELIFDKFYQCDPSRSTDGNGLGLALVKRIINLTESIIKVESEENKGTTFTVKIHKN